MQAPRLLFGIVLGCVGVILGAGIAGSARGQTEDLAKLNRQIAELYRAGKHCEAITLAERSVALTRAQKGEDDLDTATRMSWLAGLYQQQGRYAEAEPLYKRDLAITEKALGPEHPSVGTSLNNLANLYQIRGRHADAESLIKRALAISEKALSPEHREVGASLNNLARFYQQQGRYAEAEPLYERDLAITEKALGPEHREVGASLNNLAVLYREQGRYAEAEPLYKRVLAITEKALGPEDPHFAISLTGLAELYRAQGRYSEAEPLLNRGLAIQEKALGPEHSELGWPLTRLASLYQATGRNADAELLINRAVSIRQKRLGEKHKYVGTSLGVLASIHEKQGRLKDAEGLYKRALAIEESALGTEHPNVATTRGNLGGLYKSEGRYDEASPLLKSALAIREKTLPPDHPAIAASLLQLAELYRLQGQIDDAQKLLQRALGNRKVGIREVPVFFGTDRNRDAKAKSIAFGNERAAKGHITLGVAKVTILKEQASAGVGPAPSRKDDPESTDVARLQLQPLELMEGGPVFAENARQLLLRTENLKGRPAMVFVHGYSVSFENAMRRAAQIAYDLGFDGPVFLFSWPSRASVWGYISDRDAVDVAAGHLKQFLEQVVAAAQPPKVHIIAHSMGNLVVLRALERMRGDGSASRLPLGEIISAAPDVDLELFTEFVESTSGKGANVTLYASAGDWALWLSSKLSRPRAGYVAGELVPIKGADTIDITRAGTSLFALNHDVYASSPVVVADMRGILRGERPPEQRTKEFEVLVSKEGGTFWRLRAPAALAK